MAKTRDYMDYLDDEIGIAPANSQEEFQAAETIVEVMKDHGLEPSIQEFDTHPVGRMMPQVVSLVLFLALLTCGVVNGAPKVIAFLLALVCAVLLAMRHFGRNVFENFGPARRSQNVVAVHRATGDKVVKGARPIVILAHYDTPRQNVLYSSSLARYQSFLKRAAFPSTCIAAFGSLVQVLGFIPSAARLVIWVVALVASLPIVVVAVAAIVEGFGSYTTGSNDNKSSVAALMAVLAKVRPGEDRVDATIEGKPYVRRASEPAPKPQPVYEEVRGVRHGKEVLESLGMLPPDCEIVYEAPRQIIVSGGEEAPAEAQEQVQYQPEQYEPEVGSFEGEQGVEQQPQAAEGTADTYAAYDEAGYAEGDQAVYDQAYDDTYGQAYGPSDERAYAGEGYDEAPAPAGAEVLGPEDGQEAQLPADQWSEEAPAEDSTQPEGAETDAYGQLYAEPEEDAPAPEASGRPSGKRGGAGRKLVSRIKGLFHRGDGDPIAIRRGKDLTEGEPVDYSEFETKYEGDDLEGFDELHRPAGASFAVEKGAASGEPLLPITPDDMSQSATAEDGTSPDGTEGAPTAEAAEEPLPDPDEPAATEVDEDSGEPAAEAEPAAKAEPAEVEEDVEVVSVAPEPQDSIPEPIRVDDSGEPAERASFSPVADRDEQTITTRASTTAEQVSASRAARRQPRPESVRVAQDEAPEVEAEVVPEEEQDLSVAESAETEGEPQETVVAAAELDWDQPAVEDLDASAEEAEEVVDLSEEVERIAPGDTAAFKMPVDAEGAYGEEASGYDSYDGAEPDEPYDDENYDTGEYDEAQDYSDAQYEQVDAEGAAEKGGFSARVRGAFSRLRQRLTRGGTTADADAADARASEPAATDSYAGDYDDYEGASDEAGYVDAGYDDYGSEYDADYADADYDDESLEDGYADLPEESDASQGEPAADVEAPEAADPESADSEPTAADVEAADPEVASAGAAEPAPADGARAGREELDGRVSYLELGEEEEGDDILPKDTTGLDTLSDIDLDEDEETVPPRPRPRPIDDPSWGKSTYEPPSTTPNIARRAALFDLPDVSSRTTDPLSGSKDYEDEEDYEDVAGTAAEEPSSDLGDTAEYDSTTDEPTSPLRGWKGGAALRSDLRDKDAAPAGGSEDVAVAPEELDEPTPDAVPAAGDAAPEATASGDEDGELQDAILGLGDDYLIAHDIWFVCVGGSEMDHAGARSFIANFRRDLRGAFLVNLDSVGAGQLVTLTNEGYDEGRRADRRSSRLLTQTASDLQIPMEKIDYGWEETDATCAMRARVRAITVMGMDENGLPALSHTENDVPMNVDPKQVASVARLICEFIRRS